MKLTLTQSKLAAYTASQMNAFFPDGNMVAADCVSELLPRVLARLECCLGSIGNPYFSREGDLFFNHLHSDQYSMYLYILANEAHCGEVASLPDLAVKSYLLNKALHGIEVFYQVKLPEVFWFAHAVGAVLGRASYGNRLVVMQGCTVGNKGGEYPVFGNRIVLCAKSTVLGGVLGSDVCVGAGSLVIGETIPDNSIVVGSSPNLRVINKKSRLLDIYFPEDSSHV
jgi:serine O-acetyltransferase